MIVDKLMVINNQPPLFTTMESGAQTSSKVKTKVTTVASAGLKRPGGFPRPIFNYMNVYWMYWSLYWSLSKYSVGE